MSEATQTGDLSPTACERQRFPADIRITLVEHFVRGDLRASSTLPLDITALRHRFLRTRAIAPAPTCSGTLVTAG